MAIIWRWRRCASSSSVSGLLSLEPVVYNTSSMTDTDKRPNPVPVQQFLRTLLEEKETELGFRLSELHELRSIFAALEDLIQDYSIELASWKASLLEYESYKMDSLDKQLHKARYYIHEIQGDINLTKAEMTRLVAQIDIVVIDIEVVEEEIAQIVGALEETDEN